MEWDTKLAMTDHVIHKTKDRLTLIFWVIQLTVILIFTIGVLLPEITGSHYTPPRPTIIELTPNQRVVIESRFREVEDKIQEQREQRIMLVLINDVVISLIAAIFARVLATITLEPLIKNMQNQKAFASNASHELRTPLANMKLEAEVLLKDKKATPEDFRKFSASIIEEVDHLTTMTSNLLALTKAEGISTVNKQDIALQKVVDQVIANYQKQIEKKQIAVTTKNLDQTVKTDSLLLTQVLSCLVDNAIKFNIQNGTIDISFDSKLKKLAITDSGIGIDTAHIPNIFDRLYTESQSRTEGSFGIGLSIAKEVSQKLGLKLSATSEKGKFTTFWIQF